MLPPPYPPVPCTEPRLAWTLFPWLGLAVLTGGLLAHTLVIRVPVWVRNYRRARLRRLHPRRQ